MSDTAKKALIIGWDGATWEYIDPLIAQGKMPHLENFLAKGVRATMRSTIPPFTNIAWPSLVTGLLPSKTGVYDGSKRLPNNYTAIPYNILGHRGTPIWHWVNQYGRTAGVLNVPMTFPAVPLEGYIVSGFDSISESPDIMYPPDLLAQWQKQGHVYSVLHEETVLMDSQNPHQPRSDVLEFTKGWVELTEAQGNFVKWAWQNWPVDLMFVVFSGTDSINHRTNDFELISAVYQAADAALGNIIEAIDEQTVVCLVSDHGSTPAYNYISLYRILSDAGLIRFQPIIASKYIQRIPRLGTVLQKLWIKTPRQLAQLLSVPFLKRDGRLGISYDNIDWPQTTAFSRSSMGPLYINLKGKYPSGRVNPDDYEKVKLEVSDYFLGLKDADGRPIFRAIWDQKQIYMDAPSTDDIPDLILEPADWCNHMVSGFTSDPLVHAIPADREYGTHTPEGIFALMGPATKKEHTMSSCNIVDAIPTVLAACGLPIPQEVDGVVLKDAFIQAPSEQRVPNLYTSEKHNPLKNTDVDEIENRLRSLGYLE